MSTEFAKFEHDGWQRVAHKYENAWSGLTQGFIPALIQRAGISPGQLVLDVACGPGYVAESVQRIGAEPVGVDFSAEMIRIASERNPTLNFRMGDAQALEFADDTFDVVLMNFGLLHLSEPETALKESCRVLRPGGCYGFTVWAGPEWSVGARIVDDAIKEHANLQVVLPIGPDYFCYGKPDDCANELTTAGFAPESVRFETVIAEWEIPTPTFLFECERYAGVRTAALLLLQNETTLSAIRNQMEREVMNYAKGNSYPVPFAAHVITASKPSA